MALIEHPIQPMTPGNIPHSSPPLQIILALPSGRPKFPTNSKPFMLTNSNNDKGDSHFGSWVFNHAGPSTTNIPEGAETSAMKVSQAPLRMGLLNLPMNTSLGSGLASVCFSILKSEALSLESDY